MITFQNANRLELIDADQESTALETYQARQANISILLAALNDPTTIELMLNADGKLWRECLGEKAMQCIGTMRVAQAQAIIETIAGFHGKEVTRKKPILEGDLPLDGSRFAGPLPPVVPPGR